MLQSRHVCYAPRRLSARRPEENHVPTRAQIALLSLLLLAPAAAHAADLRVTDSKGTEVVVTSAVVDYGGMLSVDTESDGIRVLQGDAVVKLKWADIDSISVTKVDTTSKPSRLEVDVVTKGGKRVPATLFRQGKMTLSGKSELGTYSIDLDKVRKIAPR
jgi:hypothetical protein